MEVACDVTFDRTRVIDSIASNSVRRKTTVLVVGDSDISKLAGHDKSSKHRKAEDLIEKGIPIRIMGETYFTAMVAGA